MNGILTKDGYRIIQHEDTGNIIILKKILMDFFNQTGGSEEMEKAKEHGGCMDCVHVDLASDDYPCSECSCNYSDKYQKREEAKELTRSQIREGCDMTREEAIKLLKEFALRVKPFYEPQRTEYPQAIHMAIEALTYQNLSKPINALKALSSAEAVQGCDGSRYDTRPPQKECLYCKRYWRDSYERKGGDAE